MKQYKDTAVVFLGDDEGHMAKSLADAGISHIIYHREDEPARDAFKRALAEDINRVVTINPKDQFSIEDIFALLAAMDENPEPVYVGVRNHAQQPGLPAKLFGFLSGLHASDIETSLMGMSRAVCQRMTQMRSSDRAFLFNIPLEARTHDIDIVEIPTGCNCAEQPGFSILKQSLKLYYVFIKFSIAAFIAYLVDIGTFYLFVRIFSAQPQEYKTLYATVLSRILCSIATYLLNRGAVFKSHSKSTGAILRYIILAVGQLVASWLLVWSIGTLLGGGDFVNMLIKVVADLIIFVASFSLQRDWVFKKTDGLLR